MRRFVALFIVTLAACSPAYCGSAKTLTDEQVTELENRVQTAEPREQCFLYAQIIAQMTDRVDREIASGDIEKASAHLNRLDDYAAKLHQNLSPESKKLKEAEILIRHTTERMDAMVHQASLDNREALHAVEAKLGSLQAEMMLRVFKH